MSSLDNPPHLIKGMSYQEYQKKYQREYKKEERKEGKVFRLRGSDAMRLRMWSEEYTQVQQRNLSPIVSFHDFVIHFVDLGYNNWVSRNRDK